MRSFSCANLAIASNLERSATPPVGFVGKLSNSILQPGSQADRKAAKAQNVNAKMFAFSIGPVEPQFAAGLGSAADGMLGTTLWFPTLHTSGNPADDVFSLKTPKRLPRRLSIPQQERLLAHLAQSESLEGRRTYALVATALFCGLRVEELATLRLDHVDLEAGRLRVVGKGDKERELPIVPRLAAILREYIEQIRPRLVAVKVRGSIYRDSGHRVWQMSYRVNGERFSKSTHTSDAAEARRILADCVRDLTIEQESPYLFVRAAVGHVKRRRGKPLLTRTIFHIISTQISPVVGQPINPYQFRHSFASRLRENGPPLELIQEALGHADLRTTLIYAQISSKKRHEDLARYLEGGR